MGSDKDRLVRTGFMGKVIKFGPATDLEKLLDLLERNDYAAVRQQDIDFSAFVCRLCNRPYCESCWDIGEPEFDEGFYDCTRGICPRGHTQMVDD